MLVWGEALAPNALRTALRLHRLAARHPRLAAVGKALMRLQSSGDIEFGDTIPIIFRG